MRMHITIPDELVSELDRRVGPRGRSPFVAKAVEQALEDAERWDLIESSLGAVGGGKEWDEDPAAWVRAQRRTDARRVG